MDLLEHTIRLLEAAKQVLGECYSASSGRCGSDTPASKWTSADSRHYNKLGKDAANKRKAKKSGMKKGSWTTDSGKKAKRMPDGSVKYTTPKKAEPKKADKKLAHKKRSGGGSPPSGTCDGPMGRCF